MAEMKLQSQLRAAFAFNCIKQALALDSDQQRELKSYIQALPAMIQMNGFGQAIAFYKAHPEGKRGGKAYQLIYSWISSWLKQQSIYSQDLMQAIVEQDMASYQLATAETLALLVWLKKFARAYLTAEE
jgi:CRISPR-associated protein Cmr5